MDPVTAIGAAGSVIGIAGFGLQLSAAIYKFYSQIGDAKESLQAAVDGIDSTAVALERIYEFLQIEEENLTKGKGLLLFSNTAILGVKDTAHKCLAVFWRIEATVTNRNGPKFEQELLDRLLALKRDTGKSSQRPVLELDSSLVETASSLRNRIRWTFKGDFSKLEEYSRRLQQFQLSLTLMFSVVSLGIHQRSHQQENWKQTAAYNYIRGIAVQGNIHSIAAQFSHSRNPDQTSLSIVNFGGKDFRDKQHSNNRLSEVGPPFASIMAQRRRSSSLPPAVDSHLPLPQNHLQRRAGEQLPEGRTISDQVHHPRERSPALRTGVGPGNTHKPQDRSAVGAGAPKDNIGTEKLGRSMSRGRREGESMKPDIDTTRDPGIPEHHVEKGDIKTPVAGATGQKQQKFGKEFEGTISADAAQIGSQQGASRPRSLNTDFVSEGSSTAVPEAQMCVFIIKQGRYHAIPHRLEPGLRDTFSSALPFRQSQKSVYKKLASLSPENIAALQAVLDDGESGPQTRRLVQLSILQKSPFQFGGSKEPAVMAVVEDLYPQRPWIEDGRTSQDNDDYSARSPTDRRPFPHEKRHHQMSKEFGPQFNTYTGPNGRGRLIKRRPHRDTQDVSRDMMSRDDYQAALTTYRVWIIQQHPSLHQSESDPQSWAKCAVTEDVRGHDDIARSLLILDSKPPSVNKKRLSLRIDQQTQISRLHETVINNETDPEFQWSLRQLNLIRSKSKPFQLIPSITAIFVYLARSPRAHTDLQRLFEKQHMPEVDSVPINSSMANGAQPLSVPEPAPLFNNGNPFMGQQPKHHSHLGIRPPPPPPPVFQPPPPLPPDAPYNPYGPPDGFPPSVPGPPPPRKYDFVAPPPPPPLHSYWSSGYNMSDKDSKERPKKHETRMLARLVSKRVLIDLGYPWGNTIIVLKDLDEDQVEEILKLSEDHNRPQNEVRVASMSQKGPRRSSIDHVPPPPMLGATNVQDRSFERIQAPKNATHSLAVTAAGASDENAPRRSLYQQRSLAHDAILRRKPSDLHLRSSAIARLGIPQAEARLALEASRVLGTLQRSASDLNLAERRSHYPAQFDNIPYDPQRNADDQIINQLLVEWTPQGPSVPRGNGSADVGVKEEPVDDEAHDDLSETSATDDDLDDSSEHSSIGNHILETHQYGNLVASELQAPTAAKQDSRTRFPYDHVKDVANLASRTDSTAEIERLEEQLSMLKFKRNAKRAGTELLSKQLNERAEHQTAKRPTSGAAQTPTQVNPATVEHDNSTSRSSVPKKPAVQRRVTMDEVQDEADTKISPEKSPMAECRDGDEGGNKPVRASTFPRPKETPEAELEWAQRVLEDSTAFSEPTDPARAEIVFGSRTRRDVRAAQRDASKRRGSDRGRLMKGAADLKGHELRERRTSRVRSPKGVREPRA